MSYHGECKEISALCIEGPGGSKGLAGGQELREMAILVFQFNHTCCFICIFYCIYIHFLHSYILIIYIYIYIIYIMKGAVFESEEQIEGILGIQVRAMRN